MISSRILKLLFLASAIGFPSCAQDNLSEPQISSIDKPEPLPEDTEDWSVVPKPVTARANDAPSDAILLFDGSSLSAWKSEKNETLEWTITDGVLSSTPKTGNIQTVQDFCDVQLHIEWRSPLDPMIENGGPKGQLWGNSGVFLQSRYEVQILNSFEHETYSNGQAGSIYKQYPPLVNASLPPGEWQSFDIIFSAPRFDADGVLTSPAYMTVFHNGILIQNHAELKGTTVYIGAPEYEAHGCAPILLQDHWETIEFRNIWVREIGQISE